MWLCFCDGKKKLEALVGGVVSIVMGADRLILPTVGPPLKRRAGLRRKQAGRGSYRGS